LPWDGALLGVEVVSLKPFLGPHWPFLVKSHTQNLIIHCPYLFMDLDFADLKKIQLDFWTIFNDL
jgi:hypothetical protein